MLNKMSKFIKKYKLFWGIVTLAIVNVLLFLLKSTEIVQKSIWKYLFLIPLISTGTIFVVWFHTRERQEVKTAENIITLSLSITFIMILLGLFSVDVAEKIFPNYSKEMIGFYGSLIGSCISAILGISGSILGAIKGGEISRKATLESIKMHSKIEEDKKNREFIDVLNILMLELNNNTECIRQKEVELIDFSVWETYKPQILGLFKEERSLVNHTIKFYKILYNVCEEKYYLTEGEKEYIGKLHDKILPHIEQLIESLNDKIQ